MTFDELKNLMSAKSTSPERFDVMMSTLGRLWDLLKNKPEGQGVGDEIERYRHLTKAMGGLEKCNYARAAAQLFLLFDRPGQIKTIVQELKL